MQRISRVLKKQVVLNKHLQLKKHWFCTELKKFNESFLSGTSSVYIEQLYDQWKEDPKSVVAEWDAYFSNVDEGLTAQDTFDDVNGDIESISVQNSQSSIMDDQLRLQLLIKNYQVHGHKLATLDPLELDRRIQDIGFFEPSSLEKLDYRTYGFNEADLDKPIYLKNPNSGGVQQGSKKYTLGCLIDDLKKYYCGYVGFEYIHIQDREKRTWLQNRIECDEFQKINKDHQIKIFKRLGESHCFSNYLKTKFPTSKRFGVEGCDTFISGLSHLIDVACKHKIENVVLGMPHRGRLETLALIFKKSVSEILCEFQENKQVEEEEYGNSGDVKYHLGITTQIEIDNENQIRLDILANPSHLEAINPVVMGKVRSMQDYLAINNKNLGVMIHGDAAFAGQGMVYETLQMQDLNQYKTEGTLHIIVNNQIGFTTTPIEARTGQYCTEVAKAIGAPIFHVNGDQPELVDKCIELAMEFRQTFKSDVVVDIIGYRKHGHNELDQPLFTQPIMYNKVNIMKPIFQKYTERLKQTGVISQEAIDQFINEKTEEFNNEYNRSKQMNFEKSQWVQLPWAQMLTVKENDKTGVDVNNLLDLGKRITDLSNTDCKFHQQIIKNYEQRHAMFKNNLPIDWATAESLAFASLLEDGYKIRLSGEDVERGTFSHRHAVIVDQNNAQKYCPISQIIDNPEDTYRINVTNSHLSEQGVLGFEYGYSLENPNSLVLWEAQFGDFFNGAQVIFDNFISSAESKWNQKSNVTLLLPHGLDGLGPEHSSARMMRFLQMNNDDQSDYIDYQISHAQQLQKTNFQLVNCTTAANYFHVLRRQLIRDFRKPLVIFSPKKLLRFKGACSSIDQFGTDTQFQPIIDDSIVQNPESINRLLISQGQVYYDILAKKQELESDNVALIRLEQIAPFPYSYLSDILNKYPNVKTINFVQEEHQNDGAWWFVKSRIQSVIDKHGLSIQVKYIGRGPSASTATASQKVHKMQLDDLLRRAFS